MIFGYTKIIIEIKYYLNLASISQLKKQIDKPD